MELAKASAELSSYYEPAVEDDRRMRNPLYAATECAEDQLLALSPSAARRGASEAGDSATTGKTADPAPVPLSAGDAALLLLPPSPRREPPRGFEALPDAFEMSAGGRHDSRQPGRRR